MNLNSRDQESIAESSYNLLCESWRQRGKSDQLLYQHLSDGRLVLSDEARIEYKRIFKRYARQLFETITID